ncbi:MAG: acyl-CoA dehydrogenase family protein, partial [Holophaga sp.]|nr:acyl-CoA dehydrogenase family protein [Holophaga sp.]
MLIGQSARDFALAYLDSIAVDMDRSGTFPAETVMKLAALDFLGLLVESDYGGAQAGFLA